MKCQPLKIILLFAGIGKGEEHEHAGKKNRFRSVRFRLRQARLALDTPCVLILVPVNIHTPLLQCFSGYTEVFTIIISLFKRTDTTKRAGTQEENN
jgi:hypothetical protein